ncbi:MAG: phage terminase large subunit [Bacteroidales bacterium]|nr:phage terminase large subunit [Bacteroidales bacterium]
MARVSINIPNPNDKQRLFLADNHRHVAYGGARGGGKSWAVRVKAILLCLKWKGIKILIVRKTYKELTNNHIVPLQQMLPTDVARYNKTEKVFTFVNGSTIWFGYCNNDSDLDQYQGAEYDVIFFDEATQLQESWIKKINLAVRQPNGLPKRTYYTCNPGGASHNYIKRLFIERRYEEAEIPENYSFTQALVTDNKVLMEMSPEYKAELEALPPKLREAWLYGNWDIFEGQFFEDFREMPDKDLCIKAGISKEEAIASHRFVHVIEPFEIPDGWQIHRSFDFGYAKPFSCAWWAVNYDGVAYRILELYGCTKTPNEGVKWTPDQMFAEMARIEREHRWLKGKKIIGVADPSIWDASRGESVADCAAKHGIYFSAGDNERIAGWMQVHYRFAFDENGFPMMYVFNNCKAFIRTMPLLQFSETKPEDLDTTGEDHVADEVRYFLMSRPIKPRPIMKPDDYYKTPQSIFLDIPKEDIKPLPKHGRMEILSDG